MNRVMIIAVLLLAVAQGAIGSYTYTYGTSDYMPQLSLYTSESILFQGGAVGDLRLYDSSFAKIESTRPGVVYGMNAVGAGDTSRIEMTGGQIGGDVGLFVYGDSMFSMSGGSIHRARISENAHVDWSGGDIDAIYALDQAPWNVTIFCKDYSYVHATNVLTGTWGDSTTFRVYLGDPSGTDDYLYSQLHFVTIPEPASIALLSFGGLALFRLARDGYTHRRRRQ